MSPHVDRFPARPVEAAEAGTSSEVLAIKADIARTQAELAATIDLLQERLSPSRLARDVKQAAMDTMSRRVADLRTSAASVTAQTLTHVDRARELAGRRLRQTPLPVVLLATGVAAALYFSLRRGRPAR